jgi:hypothetical protein
MDKKPKDEWAFSMQVQFTGKTEIPFCISALARHGLPFAIRPPLEIQRRAVSAKRNGAGLSVPFCAIVACTNTSATIQRLLRECNDLTNRPEQGTTIPFGRKGKSKTRQGGNKRKKLALSRECRDAKRNL